MIIAIIARHDMPKKAIANSELNIKPGHNPGFFCHDVNEFRLMLVKCFMFKYIDKIMANAFFALLLSFFATATFAEDIQRGTITSCAYQAGTAYQIQNIRQTEDDNWQTFVAKINKIYADSQGRDDLLIIAKSVFIYPADKSLEFIHDEILNACVARQQGTESKF